jgi:penicillin-binding protein 1A
MNAHTDPDKDLPDAANGAGADTPDDGGLARRVEEFRAAAAALSDHMRSLPKQASEHLPTPRRIAMLRANAGASPDTAPAPAALSAANPPVAAPSHAPAEAQNAAPDAAATRPVAFEPAAPAILRAPEPPMAPPPVVEEQASAAPAAPPRLPARIAEEARARAGKSDAAAPAEMQDDAPNAPAPFWRRPALKTAATLFSFGAIGAAVALYAAFVVIAPHPDDKLDLWALNRMPSIVLLDRNGTEIAARGARYGSEAPVGELPPFLVNAILATEDRRFFEHHGVDLRGMSRALFANLRSGAVVEGGSTITQQLAKLLFLTPEQTYERKAREAMLALWLEGRYSKDEILTLYLNRIYFGAGAYGVESAAQTYFDKSARDVTLSEAAMLAGLPQAPSTLAPTLNPKGAAVRAAEVIENMRETGAISAEEARAAMAAPPVIHAGGEDADYGYFFDYVAAEAKKLVGADVIDLVVTTTIDQKLQKDAEAAVKRAIDVDAKLAGATQAALVAYDNTGAIRAMVGGRSYVESQFNRATQAKRQPGSAFKPIVYAAGFENGVRPTSRFTDMPIDIAGYKPENYDGKFRGSMAVSEAVARSINTIAVQVSEKIGRNKVIAMARRLGVSTPFPKGEAGIALGAAAVTLDEITGAYVPFAQGGRAPKRHAILKIADGRGRTLYQHKNEAPAQLLDPKVVKDVTQVLYGVMKVGTGRSAQLDDRRAAGKTGTTNDWRDAWFIGYTPQIIAGVWVGNDDFTPMSKVTGGGLPATIWKDFMTAAHEGLEVEELTGAVLPAAPAPEGRLLNFYAGVAEAFRRVRSEGGY